MASPEDKFGRHIEALRSSGLSIYDHIDSGLWISTPELEQILDVGLRGFSVREYPLRTRSKIVKEQICLQLGYPVPKSFKRTRPRFPGQNFDCFVQKSSNLQVWNEEIEPTRRYVIVRVSDSDEITAVKVVDGRYLASLDTTGALTTKYQARWIRVVDSMPILLDQDTENLQLLLRPDAKNLSRSNPIDNPQAHQLLSVQEIFDSFVTLIGSSFPDVGVDQERNRGERLHRLACQTLGYSNFQESGQFPDVRHQLLEIKLQTSPTIDLGYVYPTSTEILNVPGQRGIQMRICDIRYAVFFAVTDGQNVTLMDVMVTTGESFFRHFELMQGKLRNKKIQIRLPADLFDT